MTPTVTQTGETVTIWIGDASAVLSPSQADEHADAVRMSATKARDATYRRQKDEARAGQVTRFRAMYPDAVPVHKPGAWGAEEGIGVYRDTKHGPVAEVLWGSGRWITEHIDVIPAWPEPIQLRAERGRTAHIWRGGSNGVCGAPLNHGALPTPATKPCPRCTAIEAARGGAS